MDSLQFSQLSSWPLRLNLVFPSALTPPFSSLPLSLPFSPIHPSTHPSLHPSALLPRLYLFSLGVLPLLSDKCIGLQLCASETPVFLLLAFPSFHSFLLPSFFQFPPHSLSSVNPNTTHPCIRSPAPPLSFSHCFVLQLVDFLLQFGFSSLSVFFTVLCCGCLWLCVCVRVAPDCSGKHHEGEDAQERREVVVLLERPKQQHKIGNTV